MSVITSNKQYKEKQYDNKDREIWLDNIKLFACILVVLGHFYQGIVKSEIIPNSAIFQCFNQTIYYFHVPLFFIVSGYLYQQYSLVDNFMSWGRNVLKKLLALLIPYFTFSILTWIMKIIAGNYANDPPGNLFRILFLEPLSPYWFLYILFFIFLVTPTFKSGKAGIIGITFVVLLKIMIVGLSGSYSFPFVIQKLFDNEFWFVLGMVLPIVDIKKKLFKNSKKNIVFSITIVLGFVALSITRYIKNTTFFGVEFIFGLIGCSSIIIMFGNIFLDNKKVKIVSFLAKYTTPIFLMHTIFAATLRSFLIKVGISNSMTHVLLGVLVSFIGPIFAAEIIKRTKIFEFFIYPLKYIKVK